MIKNRVKFSGLLVISLMGAQVQSNDYVNNAKTPLAWFTAASALRNTVECVFGQRKAGSGFPVAGYNVQKRDESNGTARMIRLGSYSVGVRTSNDAKTFVDKVSGLRPAFDGFTLSNVAKDAILATTLWYGVQKGYFKVPSIPGLSRK